MKVVVPGMKIDSLDLITDRADAGCDAEIAEPRTCGTGAGPKLCKFLGQYNCGN